MNNILRELCFLKGETLVEFCKSCVDFEHALVAIYFIVSLHFFVFSFIDSESSLGKC